MRFTPFDDPTLEIWAMNDHHNVLPRVDVLFEPHYAEVIRAEGHWDSLTRLTIPIFMQQHFDEIPTSVAYPLEQIAQRYTLNGRLKPALTSTAAMMLAVAVDVEPRPASLHLYGLDMARDGEFDGQREAAAFWIGIATARGITVELQAYSDVLWCQYVYGYEDQAQRVEIDRLKERRAYVKANRELALTREREALEAAKGFTGEQREQCLARASEAHDAAARFDGALQNVEYCLKRAL